MYHGSPHAQCKYDSKSGFTLIELSIVLVIIGLIVGGILTGQDLIKAAGRRATLTQLERYNTATRTFQNKYGSLPGDILSSQACNFGLYCVTGASAGTVSYGDGNGLIQGYNSAPYIDGGSFEGEVAMFFLHLSQAGLVDGMYGAGGTVTLAGATPTGGSTASEPQVTANTNSSTTAGIVPAAKLGNGNYFSVGSVNGTNYFALTGITSITTTGSVVSTNNLTPLDAYAIDNKIDDGLPGTGRVFALDPQGGWPISGASGQGFTTPSANNCINGSAYYISSTFANTQNCSLRFNFQ